MPFEQPMDLQAALRELEQWKTDFPTAGQRRFARFPARGQAYLWPGEKAVGVEPLGTLHVRDISRSGVGLVSSAPATPGQSWLLQLGDERLVVATLFAACRFCRKIIDGAYLIGVEFGVDAAVLLAMGVPARVLMLGDEPEDDRAVVGDFADPKSVIGPEID
ncbi:MAG: PilZ domain-containing protein [Phycisphaerales bacterium]|nr:MAG: PilZ domain-containing protein [Phycisphaerales bacterium]